MSPKIREPQNIELKIILEMSKVADWLKSDKLTLNATKTEFMPLASSYRIKHFCSASTIPNIVQDKDDYAEDSESEDVRLLCSFCRDP